MRKKQKKHKRSILHQRDGTCYLCVMLNGDYSRHKLIHEHHVYGGPNRSISEANGFKVYLCLKHHVDGPEAVHNNHKNMRILQRECQKLYERNHTRREFMELIGRNYLDTEESKEKLEVQEENPRFTFLEATEETAGGMDV